MARSKKNWNGAPAIPYMPRNGQWEAAAHLASVARAFTKERASAAEVERAIDIWQLEGRKVKDKIAANRKAKS